MLHEYDVAIIGGGLVGGSLASALASTRLRVALIEAVPTVAAQHPSYDERVIALSLGSQRIFEAMGLWPDMAPEAEPILKVHVSERGQYGIARLDRAEEGVATLGAVVPARAMGVAIRLALDHADNIELLCPARLIEHRVHGDGVDLDVQVDGETRHLRTRLLVAADGGDSAIRERLSLKAREHAYGQDAIIATVTPDRPRTGVAFERFTDSGPLALLPMTGGRYSVVWTCRENETADLLALSDAEFLDRLQDRFGYRLGRLTRASARRAYPLKLRLIRAPVQERLVLIGNAAHSLHPVAGQGFNLGLRDVAALAEVLARSAVTGADPGAAATLSEYARWRGRDQAGTASLTDALARLFVIPLAPVRFARGAGLLGLDLLPCARHRLARRFMGLDVPLPHLARGLSLEHVND
ncbi:2-polyprenyl-6-methoxyphenol 4-hydroxylase [Thiocystis violascens DSM 198]|uniref:2-polyprenyl-6-methoxyphenol 4-hydroxylase n=2 Tax=Thiocystis violascens TaxID=73141 RepID=I3YE36_THIV6|nr:2-polyprenyl-6-methoxyphenol 4-hydroxylase [Thiocystis violascens DSM 198]